MDEQRINYLKELQAFIELNATLTEYNVEKIISRLEDEIDIEEDKNDDVSVNLYLGNLRVTHKEHVPGLDYNDERAYRALTQNFNSDILGEILRIKHLGNG